MNRLRIHVMHRIRLALGLFIGFVVARPRLFALGMRLVNRVPALKWRLRRIHASIRTPKTPAPMIPDVTPASARPVFLQLTEPEGEA